MRNSLFSLYLQFLAGAILGYIVAETFSQTGALADDRLFVIAAAVVMGMYLAAFSLLANRRHQRIVWLEQRLRHLEEARSELLRTLDSITEQEAELRGLAEDNDFLRENLELQSSAAKLHQRLHNLYPQLKRRLRNGDRGPEARVTGPSSFEVLFPIWEAEEPYRDEVALIADVETFIQSFLDLRSRIIESKLTGLDRTSRLQEPIVEESEEVDLVEGTSEELGNSQSDTNDETPT